jgi:hypothetical protein
VKGGVVLVQQRDDLALGDAHPDRPKLGEQTLGRDLPLEVLHEDEAHHAGTDAEGRAKRSGANWLLTSGGKGATISWPSGVRQRSRR